MAGYRPFDQREKLGDPPWNPEDPDVAAWELAHGHDVRLKCYPEYGCQAIEMEGDALREENAQLRDYLREKNEIIKAFAGPRGMTPEDVAFAVGERDDLRRAVKRAEETLSKIDRLLTNDRFDDELRRAIVAYWAWRYAPSGLKDV